MEDLPPTKSRRRPEFTYKAPRRLTVTARIRMPEAGAAQTDIVSRLKGLAYSSEFVRKTDIPNIEIRDPARDMVLNQYVYRTFYRLTDESEARIRRHRPLIED